MKKLVTLMLALAMIISAVGVLAEADGKITIWTWDPTFNIKAMQIAKEMYLKDHPDAVIDIQEKLSADIETAVIAANGDTSTLPDILLVQDNSFQKFVTNYPEVYADLTGKYDYEGFAQGKLAYSIVDGKNHGIPFDAGTAVAAYRTDYLEAAGYTAADLASELGDAFFEAAKQGEDAMEAWRKKVNDIVADVLQRMLVQKYLEERIGGIFDRYKKEWFGNDGTFKGIDAVIGSMNGFAGELNQVGEEFNAIYQGLSDSLKNYFTGDAEREGTSKGITSESQDSAFERNARLTTIQGHTYTLVQGMNDLNRTGNAVLDKLTGIEKNTSETNDKLDKVDKSIKDVKNMVDEIDRKGLKLRS